MPAGAIGNRQRHPHLIVTGDSFTISDEANSAQAFRGWPYPEYRQDTASSATPTRLA
ncbi:MAG: hypothetical protein QM760_07400 [Nibricoccus sp.]